jgi:alpha-D-xyloside xylohydrolase
MYDGERWHSMTAGEIPVILLVRDHTAIPYVKVAQHTAAIDWKNVELRVFSSDGAEALGKFSVPNGELKPMRLQQSGIGFVLRSDPFKGSVNWSVTRPER